MQHTPVQLLLIFALGAAALHGAWLSLLFFGAGGAVVERASNRMFGVALVSVTAYLFNYLLFLTGIIRDWPHLLGWLYPFIFFAGPAFYFFVKKSLQPAFLFRSVHVLHLLPFVFGSWQMWPVWNLPPQRKKAIVEYLLDPVSTYSLRQVLLGNGHVYVLLAYAGSAWFFAKNMEARSEYPEHRKKARWHRRFCIFFIALLLLDLMIKIGARELAIPATGLEYLLAGLLALAVQWVGYRALNRLEQFPKILPATPVNGKYRSSPLDTEKMETGKAALLQWMEREKPYLRPDLKIAELAEALGMPSHHLSQILSEAIGLHFNDFVNRYRIEEAMRRLSDERYRHLSLEALGFDCGFSSKTTFNRVFKKLTGNTPGGFLSGQTSEKAE